MIARKNHLSVRKIFTTADWHDNVHVVWARGMYFVSDDIEQTRHFRKLLDQQNPVCVSSSSLNATLLCAYSDVITPMPVRIGRKLESIMPVKLFSLPDNLSMTYECYIHYHHSFDNDSIFQNVIKKIQKSI